MRTDQGILIHIDGIDGAGKSTLLRAAQTWAEGRTLRIFDAVAWSKAHGTLPSLDDIGDADMLLTAEPTHVGIGAVIRQEIIRTGAPYSPRFIAESFAVDRGVHYKKLVIPFLNTRPNRWVIQDRGLMSSLTYHPLHAEQDGDSTLTIETLLTFHGNQIALEHRPDVFIFLDIDQHVAEERLAGRTDKADNARFETSQFQAALAHRYRREDTRAPLIEQGTRFEIIDGAQSIDEVTRSMHALLTTLASQAI